MLAFKLFFNLRDQDLAVFRAESLFHNLGQVDVLQFCEFDTVAYQEDSIGDEEWHVERICTRSYVMSQH